MTFSNVNLDDVFIDPVIDWAWVYFLILFNPFSHYLFIHKDRACNCANSLGQQRGDFVLQRRQLLFLNQFEFFDEIDKVAKALWRCEMCAYVGGGKGTQLIQQIIWDSHCQQSQLSIPFFDIPCWHVPLHQGRPLFRNGNEKCEHRPATLIREKFKPSWWQK